MVIYFSGTGNSRYAAEVAASETADEIRDAGAYIKEGKRGDFSSQRPWVFVSPTYCWQLPRLFAEFIRKSRFSGTRDAYFILTCGGETEMRREDRRILQRKRIPLQGNAGSRHAGKLCGIVFGAGGSRVPPADSGCRTEDKRQCQIYP